MRVSSGSRVKMRSDSPHPSPNNPIPSLVASVPTPDTTRVVSVTVCGMQHLSCQLWVVPTLGGAEWCVVRLGQRNGRRMGVLLVHVHE